MEVIAETERLMLRLFEQTDVDDAMTFWGNEEVMKQCNGPVPYEHLQKVLEAYSACHRKKGLSVYAIVEKETGNVIGAAGFNVPSAIENVELLYHLAKTSWGKGYATEAAIACVKVAKSNPKVRKIHASADPMNAGSQRILSKIGFEYKGMKWFEETNQEEPFYELELS